MSEVFVCGWGTVSPAGWNVSQFRDAIRRGEPIPVRAVNRPGWERPLKARQVPTPSPRPPFMAHARLRRTSPIAHYAVSAALEALGDDAKRCADGRFRLGIIFCAMSGCVNYSRRFYDEVLKEPATASPLVFPETVYNSPASHLAALLGTNSISYTIVGDPGTFLQGIALAADWLLSGRVDGCVVVGAEELDWLIADAMHLFEKGVIVGDGAGALYLKRESMMNPAIQLQSITDPHLFCGNVSRAQAAKLARAELNHAETTHLLCDGLVGVQHADRDEEAAWRDWPGSRLSPRKILGEGLMAASAWQCVAAVDSIAHGQFPAAIASVVGRNQQAIAAQFGRADTNTQQ